MNDLTSSSQNFLKLQTISLIADILSIAGFVVTLWVLLETRKLRSLYKLKVRGPSLIRDLQKMVLDLADYISNYSNSVTQIAQELGRVEIKLKSLQAKLRGSPKNSVKRVRSLIDQCEVNIENEQQVRRVCREIAKVLGSVDVVYETEYKGKMLRLFESRFRVERGMFSRLDWESEAVLQVADSSGLSAWTFPHSDMTEYLLAAVKYQVTDVGHFLEELLTA